MAKNILNKFRQDNGYKDGTYKKVWNGKEDNEVMLSILDKEADIDANKLYDSLKLAYENL